MFGFRQEWLINSTREKQVLFGNRFIYTILKDESGGWIANVEDDQRDIVAKEHFQDEDEARKWCEGYGGQSGE